MLNSQRSGVLYIVNNKKKLQEEAYFKIAWQLVFPMSSIEYPGNRKCELF